MIDEAYLRRIELPASRFGRRMRPAPNEDTDHESRGIFQIPECEALAWGLGTESSRSGIRESSRFWPDDEIARRLGPFSELAKVPAKNNLRANRRAGQSNFDCLPHSKAMHRRPSNLDFAKRLFDMIIGSRTETSDAALGVLWRRKCTLNAARRIQRLRIRFMIRIHQLQ